MEEKRAIEEYLKLQTCSNARIKKIQNVLNKSKNIIKKDLTKLQESDISFFLRNINHSDFKAWTKNDYKKIFKSFLKWYYRDNFLKWMENKNIKDGFKSVNKQKAFNKQKINKNTLIQNEELEKLLRTSKSLKWKALVTLLYESAFRPCELVILKWENLKFDDTNNLCRVSVISPKTGERREVPVKDCIVHLKRWREEFEFPDRTEKDFIFPRQTKRDKHLSEGALSVNIKRLCRKAGIREIFPYMFRHSRIYEIQKRLGSRLASKFAGHSLETSEIYNHLDNEDVEEAMLQKVYTTKELSPEEKTKIEKDNEQLKKRVDDLEKMKDIIMNLGEENLKGLSKEKSKKMFKNIDSKKKASYDEEEKQLFNTLDKNN